MEGQPAGSYLSICKQVKDSRDHLFFECQIPGEVWLRMKTYIDLEHLSARWEEVATEQVWSNAPKTAVTILRRLAFAAIVYHVWRERNNRIHHRPPKTAHHIFGLAFDEVRIKLLALNKRLRFPSSIAAKWLLTSRYGS